MTAKLAIVLASRNDDHGGNPLRRTALALATWGELAAAEGLAAELIVVDWNTPRGVEPLCEVLPWRRLAPSLTWRFLTVGPEEHARLPNADRVPFFQMIAKNVGIRRATAPWVLATNLDVLPSRSLVRWLAQAALDDACVYRIDRLDVRLRDLPDDLDADGRLAVCSLNVARVNRACDDGGIEPRAARRRYAHAAGLETPIGTPRIAALERSVNDSIDGGEPHLGAAGDFTLLARRRWHELRGHPELPVYSLHLDSLFLHAALARGARQVVLPDPLRLYHLEHGMGWGVLADRSAISGGRPILAESQVRERIARIRSGQESLPWNEPDWGLADRAVDESEPREFGRSYAAIAPAILPSRRPEAA